MVLYGFKPKYIQNTISNIKLRNNKKNIKYGFCSNRVGNLNYKFFSFHVPYSWKIVALSPNTLKSNDLPLIYLYSKTYYYHLILPKNINYLNLDSNTNSVLFWSLYTEVFWRTYWTFLNQTFSAFSRPFFLKIKFKGKGYYIFKNKKQTITPQFGHSHRLYLYSSFASVKFLSKTHILVFGLLKSDTVRVGLGIYNMRPINIFTGRGVRFSRQVIYRKQGKVSSYK